VNVDVLVAQVKVLTFIGCPPVLKPNTMTKYELHIGQHVDASSKISGQIFIITEDQLEALDQFAHKIKDAELNTVYKLNECSFRVLPHFGGTEVDPSLNIERSVWVIYSPGGETIGVADSYGKALKLYEERYHDTPEFTGDVIKHFRLNRMHN
jgi:hypothetical protein